MRKYFDLSDFLYGLAGAAGASIAFEEYKEGVITILLGAALFIYYYAKNKEQQGV